MTFVVTGGRGALGRHVVAALPGAQAVSRSTGTDLLHGTGLGALRADVVVHCATSFRREVDMARTVLAARPAGADERGELAHEVRGEPGPHLFAEVARHRRA